MEKQGLLRESFDDTATDAGLQDSASENPFERSALYKQQRRRPWWLSIYTLHVLLIATNFVVCIFVIRSYQSKYARGPVTRYSPATPAVEYEARPFDLTPVYFHNGSSNTHKKPNLLGEPSEELDAAWRDLLKYNDIRVSKSELGMYKDDKGLAAVADGSGYFVGLHAYHGLHCVQQIHHWLHREYYFSDISDTDALRQSNHVAHCLDTLRQVIQCQGDTTIFPMYWGTEQPIPIGQGNFGLHQCVKWERLEGWMQEHTFDPTEPGMMVHPKLGPAFPTDSEGERIGYGKDKPLFSYIHTHAE